MHDKRFSTARNEGNVFAVHLVLAHDKGDEQANEVNIRWKKNVCRSPKKRTIVCRAPT
jgi:hypothetical protein